MRPFIDGVGAVVAAAGLSSRMGAFKPLLPIGSKPLLQRTVDSLCCSGIRRIVVVAGRQAEDVEALLVPQGITVVRNAHFAQSTMLQSVQLGLKALKDTEYCFVLPGDMPMIAPHTLRLLLEGAMAGNAAVLYPLYRGQREHPPLISERCYASILHYQGDDGLKGALSLWQTAEEDIPVPDRGCTLDADTPADYERLLAYWQHWAYPDAAMCADILAWAQTPAHVIRHAQAVAEAAGEIGEALVQAGKPLDLALIKAGALLHDVLRLEPAHAWAGAALLEELGRVAVAAVIKEHMDLSPEAGAALDERAVVFLADKLVQETGRVSLAERYAQALQKFAPETAEGHRIRQNLQQAQTLLARVEASTGLKLEKNRG